MIRLIEVSKSFAAGRERLSAVQSTSLAIAAGDIFGIIGTSGAGKSTLLRMINLLERPDTGQVLVNGLELTALKPAALRRARRSIGMIFQQFNLLQNANVFDNVALPLRFQGVRPEIVRARVSQCLEFVGLSDKSARYPAQLSGGQRQRVAIARALSTEPAVLLCDEPTSSLDSDTTRSVLSVLRDIQQRLGVTIVIVTHQLEVVRTLCNRVAVMRQGHLIEEPPVQGEIQPEDALWPAGPRHAARSAFEEAQAWCPSPEPESAGSVTPALHLVGG